jgi:16S rRNA (cytidine1402-2'-O)-methyltransferase
MARGRKTSETHSSTGAPSAPSSREAPSEPRTGDDAGKSFPSYRNARETIAATEDSLAPGLYVTATPIGNASDITLRALNVLRQCDAIVAEDTRVTAKLLAIYGISRPLLVYNDHNAREARPKLLAKLKDGARLALVSDAGTPLVSDPGHRLVRAVRDAGIAVFPVPGASALLSALVAAGLPSDTFLFAGFLSAKDGERRTRLRELRTVPATLVFYESPRRLAEALPAMADILGPRRAVVARELTKLHEEIREGTLDTLAGVYGAGEPPKGEVTIVVAPPPEESGLDLSRIDPLLEQALGFMPVKAAAQLVSDATGTPRRIVYERALVLKGKGVGDADGEI